MEPRDKQDVMKGLGQVRGLSGAAGRRVPQDCGDVGLKIARNGNWYYQDSPIGRKPLVKLFASVLRREPDGHYYLVTPAERALILVEEVPFIAVEMRVEGSGQNQRLIFRTNVDDEVTAGGDHPLRFRPERDGSFTPFVLVRDGLEARLDRPIYYDLVDAAVTKRGGGNDELGVWSGGTFFRFPPSHDSGQD
jgi:uncharacterized protein